MNAPKATRVLRHPSGATTNVHARYCAPERQTAKVSLAEWRASKGAPVGFWAKVWGAK